MRFPVFHPLFGAVFIVVMALVGRANATVVVVPTLEEMAVTSEVVADVVVLDQRVEREGARIVTRTTIEVKDGLKGSKKGDRLELWQLGGTLDGKTAWIVGAQHFQKGEHMMFFGVRHPSGGPTSVVPYGIGFGVFDVVPDSTGAAEHVVEVVGDVVELRGSSETTPPVRTYASLPAFKETVKKALVLADVPTVPVKQKLAPSLHTPPKVRQ